MPVILFLACLVWLLSTVTVQKGKAAVGRMAQEKCGETLRSNKDSITDASAECAISEYIQENHHRAWEEADRFTEDLPTWKKVRSLGYEPHVAVDDVLTVLMVVRYGKLPRFKSTLPQFSPPSYFSQKRSYQYNPILMDEFVLAIEGALRRRGHDIKLIVRTREYDRGNRRMSRYYTLSDHILSNGERDDILKDKSTDYVWSYELTPAERQKLDTGLSSYGTDFIGF